MGAVLGVEDVVFLSLCLLTVVVCGHLVSPWLQENAVRDDVVVLLRPVRFSSNASSSGFGWGTSLGAP